MTKFTQTLGIATLLAVTSPAVAKEARSFVVNNEAVGVPVFPNDITDRPYRILGEVKAGVRKATIFSGEPSQQKIYRELWERAEKLGADAVIKAQYGDAHVTALSWGKTGATGTAIKFLESRRSPADPAQAGASTDPKPQER